MRSHPRRALAAALAGAACLLAPLVHATPMRLVVPAYQYPTEGGTWAGLAAAASHVPLAVILDPANGPGDVQDPNYVAAVNAVRAAGGKVYGYVYSHYAARGADTVLADAARYPSLYPIDGVFVDEVTADAAPAHLAYYAGLVAGIHAALPGLPVMGNPGIACDSAYVASVHFDELLVFEHFAGYESWSPAAWMLRQPPTRFVNLLYARHSAASMRDAIRRAASLNVAGVYVSADSLPNPWYALPPFWADEVAMVETTTVAPAGLAAPSAAASIALAPLANPARGEARFGLAPANAPRALEIFDARGRCVGRVVVGASSREAVWDGRDTGGRRAPAGVYFARVTGGTSGPARRFVLLR